MHGYLVLDFAHSLSGLSFELKFARRKRARVPDENAALNRRIGSVEAICSVSWHCLFMTLVSLLLYRRVTMTRSALYILGEDVRLDCARYRVEAGFCATKFFLKLADDCTFQERRTLRFGSG
jgi:hypothetical protein